MHPSAPPPTLRTLSLAPLPMCALLVVARAQDPVPYELLPDSTFQEQCLLCGLVSPPVPMRGAFDLVTVSLTPLFANYALSNFVFAAGSVDLPKYTGSGAGALSWGGEAAVTQSMSLDLNVIRAGEPAEAFFQTPSLAVTAPWPTLTASLTQTNGTGARTYYIKLHAEPVKEIPFTFALTPAGRGSLTWATNIGPCTVLVATELAPGPDWAEVSPQVVQSGTNFTATFAITNNPSFFRLHAPGY